MGLSCRELILEEKASAIRYRNTFGTQRVGGFIANAFDLYLKNPANTNVVEWGKRLLALWEVGHIPYVCDCPVAICAAYRGPGQLKTSESCSACTSLTGFALMSLTQLSVSILLGYACHVCLSSMKCSLDSVPRTICMYI